MQVTAGTTHERAHGATITYYAESTYRRALARALDHADAIGVTFQSRTRIGAFDLYVKTGVRSHASIVGYYPANTVAVIAFDELSATNITYATAAAWRTLHRLAHERHAATAHRN